MTTDDPADPVDPLDPDEGDLAFLYTGDDMADPERRDFPVQPDEAPELPFTITEFVAVSTGGDTEAPLGYIWHVRNAKVSTGSHNVVFAFGGYAITDNPYLDITVRGDTPRLVKIDATMYTIDVGDLTPLRVRQAKKGKTKVVINGDATPLVAGDLGFVQLTANPSVIAIGDTTTLAAQLLTPEHALDTSDGIPLSVASPIALGPINSINGSATFPTYTPPAPGRFPIAASAPDYTPIPSALAVIEVKELTPDRGTPAPGNSTSPPDEIPCWYVPIDPAHPTLTVNAVPNIPLPDDKLPASWTLRQGESGQDVPHSGSHPEDTRQCITLDALTPGEHLIIANCGASERKLCVVVYDPPPSEGVDMYINDQRDEDDDLVMVAPDTTNPRVSTELHVVLYGEAGETKSVVLEVSSGNNGLTLDRTEFDVTVGAEEIVNITATTPSAEWNKDIIDLRYSDDGEDGEVQVSEDLTAVEVGDIILTGRNQANTASVNSETRFAYPEAKNGSDHENVEYVPELIPAPAGSGRVDFDRLYGRQVIWTLGTITGVGVADITPRRDNGDERAYGVRTCTRSHFTPASACEP